MNEKSRLHLSTFKKKNRLTTSTDSLACIVSRSLTAVKYNLDNVFTSACNYGETIHPQEMASHYYFFLFLGGKKSRLHNCCK